MNITHVDGHKVDTDKLGDVDAILMEKSKELHALFASYNRQMLIVGEMKFSEKTTSEHGGVFFHVAKEDSSEETIRMAYGKYWWRVNGSIMKMTNGELYIARTNPPSETVS